MGIIPLGRDEFDVGLDSYRVVYGGGAITAYKSPQIALQLPNCAASLIGVAVDGGTPSQLSPFASGCGATACSECRQPSCQSGPPASSTQMRHLSFAADVQFQPTLLLLGNGNQILRFVATSSDLLSALRTAVAGVPNLDAIVFHVYKIDTWQTTERLPIGTYIAIPALKT